MALFEISQGLASYYGQYPRLWDFSSPLFLRRVARLGRRFRQKSLCAPVEPHCPLHSRPTCSSLLLHLPLLLPSHPAGPPLAAMSSSRESPRDTDGHQTFGETLNISTKRHFCTDASVSIQRLVMGRPRLLSLH